MSSKKQDAGLPDYALVERHSMLRGLGYGSEALGRPQIGVVSSWGEINPASIHLNRVVEQVKAGIWSAGGTPREFVISSICTSMAGNDNYHLPHRDLVAGYIETVAMTNLFDAMVFVPVCDDVIPAHLMAAGRLNLPGIVLTGGYMRLNRHKGEILDPLAVAPKHFAMLKAGEISENEYGRIEDLGCPGSGACPVMGTANTMAAMAEALGMSLPYNTTTPGADSRLSRMAFSAGEQIMHLWKEGIRPSDVMSPGAFANAIRILMAMGGSTNAVLHLQAIASELDIALSPQLFNEISEKTPFICDVAPSGSGKYLLGDLDEAGGIPSVMKELQQLMDREVITVTGQKLGDLLEFAHRGDGRVIHSMEAPMDEGGGLIHLVGSLAPGGALIKTSAVPATMMNHVGPARIFQSEEDACQALENNEINAGEVVVVRYVGPKGDPGMRLLQRFLWMLAAGDMRDKVAFITDGRFSGTNKGCAVAHIAPEAAAGGPLALIRDGDIIEIDIPGRRLDVQLTDDELTQRGELWERPPSRVKKGYLTVYSKLAKSADEGAALRYDDGE